MRDFFNISGNREVFVSAGRRNFENRPTNRLFDVLYGKNNVRGGYDRASPPIATSWETWGDTHLTIEEIVGTFEDYD